MLQKTIKVASLKVNPANPRTIKDDKFRKLVASIRDFPAMMELRPIVADADGTILGGNMRYRAICELGMKEIPEAWVKYAGELTDEEKRRFVIEDNAGFGEWDWDALANEWDAGQLSDWGVDMPPEWAAEGAAAEETSPTHNGSLTDRFVVPPFSILDSRQGYWQERKNMWRGIIGNTQESREDKLRHAPEMKYKRIYKKSRLKRKELGITFPEYLEKYVSDEEKAKAEASVMSAGVSLFDPVLAEIICKWFTPGQGAAIFDPMAGDTQKGVVFGTLGYDFTGIEIREEQVRLNNEAVAGRNLPIRYVCDDGNNVLEHIERESRDLLFSCPPYYDLEHYSDLPGDASNAKTYNDFIRLLESIFTRSLACLKDNRFAVIVVGDDRDKDGYYRMLPDDVKRIFAANGCRLKTEMIYVEKVGSTAMRAAKQMDSRSVAKVHQNVLVFYKGGGRIKDNFPAIDCTEDDVKKFIGDEIQEEGDI